MSNQDTKTTKLKVPYNGLPGAAKKQMNRQQQEKHFMPNLSVVYMNHFSRFGSEVNEENRT